MGLARSLVDLERTLYRRTDIDPFLPIEQSGVGSSPECAAVTARLASTAPWEAVVVTRLCLQALRIQHEELQPQLLDAELVATLPSEMPGLARPTRHVVREMVDQATHEVILLGYEFTDPGTVQLLAEAAGRGADVAIICDRGRGVGARICAAWPTQIRLPRIFHDKERMEGAPYASMHAKCLLVDGKNLLVTSANFTFHGLDGNIEIGVRLSGAPAAEARKIFSHLVESGVMEAIER